ncbi:MAG: DUF3486 family protein [Proteobacteria bacterium]|nr:DUF3486 family protein [Pseudomonadota bacterium]
MTDNQRPPGDDQKVVELRPGKKRRRLSTIDLLPKDVRDALNEAIAEGRMRVDDLWDLVREKGGAEISRSAVQRYKVREERALEQVREMQRMAGVVVQEAGKDPNGQASRLLGELTKNVLFRRLSTMTPGEMEKMGTRDMTFLASAVRSIASADKISAEREAMIRDRAVRQERERAGREVEKVAKAAGMSRKTVEELRAVIIGGAT